MINPLKFFFSSFLLLIIFCSNLSFPQEPFNPMTANGATGISIYGHILFWQNPDSTAYNKIYFSDDISLVNSLDTSAILIDGYPDTAYSSVSLNYYGVLDVLTNYYWRIVEYNHTDSVLGQVWYFKSQISFSYNSLFFDDFEDTNFTNENWKIVNDGGNCIWEQYFPPYPYLLPNHPAGGVLAADSDECGSGSTLLSSATIGPFQPVFNYGVLEFDQDFNAIDTEDEAWVETSTDNGLTWNEVWSQIGVDLRETHEYVLINSSYEFRIRFRSVQPGWDWWWAIDNVFLSFDPYSIQIPPNFLKAEADSSELIVNLNWNIGDCVDPISGYEIQRKDGLPLDTVGYSVLAVVDENTFSFTDNTVLRNSNYTYKIRTLCGPPSHGSIWGNEATAYVPDIITTVKTKNELPTQFSLEQNFPNPFNPTTKIKFTIPTSPLNSSPYQGDRQRERLITLKVYDVLGREIAILINEEKPPGSYEVEFNAEGLTSGIYFYQLRAGGFNQTKKMVLAK